MSTKLIIVAFAHALFAPWSVFAQSGERPAALADPVNTKTRAAAARYSSAFEGYRRYEEPEIALWGAANEQARAPGGHVGRITGTAPRNGSPVETDKPSRPAPPMQSAGNWASTASLRVCAGAEVGTGEEASGRGPHRPRERRIE